MSWRVPVVKIPDRIGKHPNADNLSLCQIEGETVIFRTGDFQPGQVAIYVPEDSVVPETVPGTEFLGRHRRIRAKKIRGIFSCGLLLPYEVRYHMLDALEPGASRWLQASTQYIGCCVADELGIIKWEEPMDSLKFGGEDERDPGCLPVYGVESYRKYSHIFIPGESVVVTEKLHGTNFRAVWFEDRFYVGSHRCFKRENNANLYWQAASRNNLKDKLATFPGVALYGEVYGQVQDLKYGAKPGEIFFAAFDAYNTEKRQFLDHDQFLQLCDQLDIPTVPSLYRGPYEPALIANLVEAKSAIADHNREGVVVKTATERWNPEIGRTIAKFVSEWYRLRKNGTEGH